MITLLRVDLRSDIDPHEYPSRTLWSVENEDRPEHQTPRKLLLDAETGMVIVDDRDLIPSSHWIRARAKREIIIIDETDEQPEPASFVAEAATVPAVRRRGKHGSKK